MKAFRVLALVVIASLSGWLAARNAIVSDCDRLGAFYDGKHVHGYTPRSPTTTPGILTN